MRAGAERRGVTAVCLTLSALTVYLQVERRGWTYVDAGPQVRLHARILDGRADDPRQYRVLFPFVNEAVVRALRAAGAPHPYGTAFVGVRLIQNTLIFLAANAFYRALGVPAATALAGLALLAWSMSQALYDSDLQFSTYGEVVFFLVAALFLVRRRYAPFPLLAAVAALNRETSGFIPVLLLVAAFSSHWPRETRAKVVIAGLVALACWGAVVWAVRSAYGPHRVTLPYGHHLGMDVFWYNVLRGKTWTYLLRTVTVLPVLCAVGYRGWPPILRVFLWTIVPLWFVFHFFAAVVAETRLFLVPVAVVLVPGSLLWWEHRRLRRAAVTEADSPPSAARTEPAALV